MARTHDDAPGREATLRGASSYSGLGFLHLSGSQWAPEDRASGTVSLAANRVDRCACTDCMMTMRSLRRMACVKSALTAGVVSVAVRV